MKTKTKFMFTVLAFVMLCLTTMTTNVAYATDTITKEQLVRMKANQVGIIIDGKILTIPESMGIPFLDDRNRVQIPVRLVSEALGYNVAWDGKTNTVTINGDIIFTIGSNLVKVGSTTVVMDTKAVTIENRTFLPVRFVSEALGAKVTWEQRQGVNFVVIDTSNKVPVKVAITPNPNEVVNPKEPIGTVIDASKYPFSGVNYEGGTGGSGFGANGWVITSIDNPKGGSFTQGESFDETMDKLQKTWTAANGTVAFTDSGSFVGNSGISAESERMFSVSIDGSGHPVIEFYTFPRSEDELKASGRMADMCSGLISAIQYFTDRTTAELVYEHIKEAFWDSKGAGSWANAKNLPATFNINGHQIQYSDPGHYGLRIRLQDVTVQ